MKSKIIMLGLASVVLSGCKELNEINWPAPIREQLVKYNIVEPLVDPTLTKEVQTVPTPESIKNPEEPTPNLTVNLPDLPVQKMGETGPIFEQSITTGDDALQTLQGKDGLSQSNSELQAQPAVQAPVAPPNLFGTPLPASN